MMILSVLNLMILATCAQAARWECQTGGVSGTPECDWSLTAEPSMSADGQYKIPPDGCVKCNFGPGYFTLRFVCAKGHPTKPRDVDRTKSEWHVCSTCAKFLQRKRKKSKCHRSKPPPPCVVSLASRATWECLDLQCRGKEFARMTDQENIFSVPPECIKCKKPGTLKLVCGKEGHDSIRADSESTLSCPLCVQESQSSNSRHASQGSNGADMYVEPFFPIVPPPHYGNQMQHDVSGLPLGCVREKGTGRIINMNHPDDGYGNGGNVSLVSGDTDSSVMECICRGFCYVVTSPCRFVCWLMTNSSDDR